MKNPITEPTYCVNPNVHVGVEGPRDLSIIVDDPPQSERITDFEQLDTLYALTLAQPVTRSAALSSAFPSLSDDTWEALADANILVPCKHVTGPRQDDDSALALRISTFSSMIARLRTYRPVDATPAQVVDDAFSRAACNSIDSWIRQLNFSRIDRDRDDTMDLHWVHTFSPPALFVRCIPFLRAIDEAITTCYVQHSLALLRAHAYSCDASDVFHVHQDSEYPDDITAVYYSSVWEDHWGGELIFYDRAEPRWVVPARADRLVIFRGCIPHRIGAISTAIRNRRHSVVLRYGSRAANKQPE